MCLTPVTLRREYSDIKGRMTNVVPCGKCPECLANRRHSWAFRLLQELKHSKSATFATLTYSPENEPISENGIPTLNKVDVQKFIKRLRKGYQSPVKDESGKIISPIKYYLCGEYGEKTERPHYHAIIFNMSHELINYPFRFQDVWQHGFTSLGDVTAASIYYTTKYMMKGSWKPKGSEDDRQREFSNMSKGLGLKYLTPQMERYLLTQESPVATMEGGQKIVMPRYFKQKVWSKQELHYMNLVAEREANEPFKDERHKSEWIKQKFSRFEQIKNQKRNESLI